MLSISLYTWSCFRKKYDYTFHWSAEWNQTSKFGQMKQLKSVFVTTYMNRLVYWYVHFQSSIAQQRESSLRWIKQCPMHWTIGNHKSWSRWAKHSLHEFVQRKSSYIFHLFTALLILVAVVVWFARKIRTLSDQNKFHQHPCWAILTRR